MIRELLRGVRLPLDRKLAVNTPSGVPGTSREDRAVYYDMLKKSLNDGCIYLLLDEIEIHHGKQPWSHRAEERGIGKHQQ